MPSLEPKRYINTCNACLYMPMTPPNTLLQTYGNLDLESGWGSAFSTGVNEPTLVARAGIFTPGRTYTFSLTATDSDGAAGYAGKSAYIVLIEMVSYVVAACCTLWWSSDEVQHEIVQLTNHSHHTKTGE